MHMGTTESGMIRNIIFVKAKYSFLKPQKHQVNISKTNIKKEEENVHS